MPLSENIDLLAGILAIKQSHIYSIDRKAGEFDIGAFNMAEMSKMVKKY